MKTITKSKYLIIWLIIWLSIISFWVYATSTQPWAIWSLFYKKTSISSFDESRTYRLHWDAIADNTIDNSEIENDEDYLVKSVSLWDSNTKLSKWSLNSLNIQTANWYISIWPMNSSYSHFITWQPKFYFNKRITINEWILSSYDEDLQLQTAWSTKIFIEKDNWNIGIWTTSPSQKLEIMWNIKLKSNSPTIYYDDMDHNNFIQHINNNRVYWMYDANDNNYWDDWDDDRIVMYGTSWGLRLWIWTSYPTQKLDVRWNIYVNWSVKTTCIWNCY